MKKEEFERINTLSEKIMNDLATPSELEEFTHLLISWNASATYNLLQGLYEAESKTNI